MILNGSKTSMNESYLASSSNSQLRAKTPKLVNRGKLYSSTPLMQKGTPSKANSMTMHRLSSTTKKSQLPMPTPTLTHNAKRPVTPLAGHKSFKVRELSTMVKSTNKQRGNLYGQETGLYSNPKELAEYKLAHSQNLPSEFSAKSFHSISSVNSKLTAVSLSQLQSHRMQKIPSYNINLNPNFLRFQSSLPTSLATFTPRELRPEAAPSRAVNESAKEGAGRPEQGRGAWAQTPRALSRQSKYGPNLRLANPTNQIKGGECVKFTSMSKALRASGLRGQGDSPTEAPSQPFTPNLNRRLGSTIGAASLAAKPRGARVISAAVGHRSERPVESAARGAKTPLHPAFMRNALVTKATLRSFALSWVNRYTEDPAKYKEGGYCRVQCGDVLNQRYRLLSKLGWGEFSVVWLAKNAGATTAAHAFVAVKITKGHPSIARGTEFELALLRHLSAAPCGTTTPLVDQFLHASPHGEHLCIVMPVMGSNLLCVVDQMKQRRRFRREREVNMVKDVAISTLYGLRKLEGLNIVHTDLKPENVLVARPDPQMVQLAGAHAREGLAAFAAGAPGPPTVLADFGLSCLLEPPGAGPPGPRRQLPVAAPGKLNNERGVLIQTREYRAPEVLFGATITPRSDIWSLGCMVYELITGDFLLDPKKYTRDEDQMDAIHVAMFIELLGPVPPEIASPARNKAVHLPKYFDKHGNFTHNYTIKERSLPRELNPFLSPSEAHWASKFIMSCFSYTAEDRMGADDLLNHPWLESRFR